MKRLLTPMKHIKKIKSVKIKKFAKCKLVKACKWLNKPSKLKKWQIFLVVYLMFSLFYIFWPHSPAKSLPSMFTIPKPIKVLKQPPTASYAPLVMANYPFMPPGTYGNNYAFGNCTALAASMVAVPNSLGNANAWDDQATVRTNIPVIGMIAQTDAGWAGHVAVVIAVGDGTVTVEEANYDGFNIIDTRTTPISDWVYLAF